ncbi:DnaJ family domain-containing protein [Aestuariimicrobium sp. T2.26MG-19.2B]|uniref:DnaJ family domain-containing protein n=1 Tax=Aestuariimicrobium sp. T2.26MG-19.2B TaxID=3040679 RepID=UPI002477BA2F|nr:DUF1992 domain-containing protein [Aestuariimicrobium sp. T2.26MG-19.2B]CAI9405745.1 hypothetical protein AESSP_01477 [Aestuariimicrobium sp. T2.26MG-19.2B]
MGFENWIDRQIREATERGEFSNLPGEGKPVDLGRPGDDEWWIRRKLEKEDLRGAMPTSLALRREKQDIQQTLADVRGVEAAREIIADLNDRIRDANVRQTERVPIFTRELDIEEVLAEWMRRQGLS